MMFSTNIHTNNKNCTLPLPSCSVSYFVNCLYPTFLTNRSVPNKTAQFITFTYLNHFLNIAQINIFNVRFQSNEICKIK